MPFHQKLISFSILDIIVNVYLQVFQAPCDRADNGSNEYRSSAGHEHRNKLHKQAGWTKIDHGVKGWAFRLQLALADEIHKQAGVKVHGRVHHQFAPMLAWLPDSTAPL